MTAYVMMPRSYPLPAWSGAEPGADDLVRIVPVADVVG